MRFETTIQYWDCNCEHRYIHRSDEFKCPICNYEREDGADARVTEVQALGLELVAVTCNYCSVSTYSQNAGDGCHSCLRGTMQ